MDWMAASVYVRNDGKLRPKHTGSEFIAIGIGDDSFLHALCT